MFFHEAHNPVQVPAATASSNHLNWGGCALAERNAVRLGVSATRFLRVVRALALLAGVLAGWLSSAQVHAGGTSGQAGLAGPSSVTDFAQPTLSPGVANDAANAAPDSIHLNGAPPLRVVMLRSAQHNYPHRNVGEELNWLSSFARGEGRALTVTTVSRSDELPALLRSGAHDLVVGELPPNLAQSPDLASSESFHQVRYQLVGPAGSRIKDPLELAGRRIAIRLSSPLWPYFERLAAQYPDTYLAALPEYMPQAEVLKALSKRRYDFSVLPATEPGRPDPLVDYPSLTRHFDLTSSLPIAFLARAEDAALLARIDAALKQQPLYAHLPPAQLRNLEAIRESGVLRVITQPNGQNFYLRAGRPAGLEFEMARHFAANLGVEPEFLLAETEAQMLDWLEAGIGDLITMPIQPDAALSQPGVAFTREYHVSTPIVVSPENQPIDRLEDLHGRRVGAEAGTPAYRALTNLLAARPDISATLVKLAAPLDPAQALVSVRRQGLDALVIEAQRLEGDGLPLEDLHTGVALPNPTPYRWAYRTRDDAFGERIDRFLTRGLARGTFAATSVRVLDHAAPGTFDALTPFDQLLKEYAGRYQFDWRLLAAVAFQESRFDPDARSPDGARGLMQVMPRTAASLGFREMLTPEDSMHAGTKYLATLRDRFDRRLPLRERTFFALAAYNAGPSRLDQARTLAGEMGLNPDIWFDNVELAMSRLGQPVHRRLSEDNPPCWCDEPVNYVRRIARYYDNYRTFSRIARDRGQDALPLAMLDPLRPADTP